MICRTCTERAENAAEMTAAREHETVYERNGYTYCATHFQERFGFWPDSGLAPASPVSIPTP